MSPGATSIVVQGKPLPAYMRLFFYGLHGFFDEILFTAIYDYIFLNPDPRLIGYTSIYSFVMYGSCSLLVERLYVYLWYRHRVATAIRVLIYVIIAFTWEFVFGLVLRQFNACSWDYSDRSLNLMGLITLTYAPGWALLALWQDVIAELLLKLRILPPTVPTCNKSH
ncbi:transmembrane protein 229A-like [Saccoglossus kowalevskii]|uniref:Transmembrane protein 229A-like n=1 Tax=Saccoglossus kowalevskii TaxID=10224 RepID=A0ABM0MLC0_SACKO|nr:PREDICTED: transmembrane protein 229A-like [Saccoglossus kowalevskii]